MYKCLNLKQDFSLIMIDSKGNSVPNEENITINESAYHELLISMNYNTPDGLAGFNIVKNAKNPDGTLNGRLAFERLHRRFEPNTSLERAKKVKEFYSLSCGN